MFSGSRTPRLTSGTSSANNSVAGSYSKSRGSNSRQERMERQTNFKVVIRVRPPLQRELSGEVPFRNVVAVDDREQCITVSENIEAVVDQDGNPLANPGPFTTYSFMFDYVYDQYSTQEKVYETTARTIVESALQGYNATIFAYGQTGAGKTYTMEGFHRGDNIESRGIIPRAIEQVFGHIQNHASPRRRFLVRASYLQIYNEQISDLLKPERNNLAIREDKKRGVYVDGLSEWVVRSPAEIYGLMERGAQVRATGETKMNEVSSRSHAVFIVIAEQSETVYVDDNGVEMSPEEFQKFMHGRGVRREQEMNRLEDHVRQTFKVGKLNLVDLAGSERVQRSGATGQRFEESKQINKSLTMLGYVISALTEAKDRQHVPYRNSKLTRMLEDSLGGNCKTTMMAMISPAFEAMLETISTLKFANRAKNIKNEARVNEDLDQKSLLRKYERELKRLRAELEERNKNVVDKRRLLELDEQRRRAEADKMAAIRALEARSLEFMQEKEEKKKLEQRIAMLMNQMIRGERPGGAMTPGAMSASSLVSSASPTGYLMDHEGEIIMKEQQDALRQEYESKLAGLERERVSIEEEKAQVDRYKQLLLKQRDIMIALTQRLVERDEQIMALQDELDAYDRHHKELEEKLDEKTALLIKFKRISMEVNAKSPHKSEELSSVLDAVNAEVSRSENNDISNGRNNTSGGSGSTSATGNKKFSSGPQEILIEDDDQDNDNDPDRIVPAPNVPPPKTPSASGGQAPSTPNPYLEEKLKGLNSMVENQKLQISNLESRLAENQLLSSRLEKMFLNEMENYLKDLPTEAMRQSFKDPVKQLFANTMKKAKESNSLFAQQTKPPEPGSTMNNIELQSLREENEKLKNTIQSIQSNPMSNGQAGSGDVASLQNKCENLVREREAVQTIMEHKIKVLVQSVAQATGVLVNSLPPNASPASQALAKDVAALQRLVNASVAALKNAAAASGNPSSAPPPPPSIVSSANITPNPTGSGGPFRPVAQAAFPIQGDRSAPLRMSVPSNNGANAFQPPSVRASYPSASSNWEAPNDPRI